VGRILGGGVRLQKRLRETSLGSLYRAEYPSGAEAEVLILSFDSVAPVTLALLRERFGQASRIQHPNVAAIHELSQTDDGLVYLVAECLSGELLSETLAQRGTLPLEDALNLCLQAAAGLQAAHRVHWIHGRLSPDTILLTHPAGGQPLVKLIGFDLDLLGKMGAGPMIKDDPSADYASPERIAGQPPDERSDVYSLAAVLHHLLTGRPPTRGWRGGRAPAELRAALNHALAPMPALRFQTAEEFAAALRSTRREETQILPAKPRADGRNVLAIGAVAASFVGVAVGVWLLWGTPRPPAVAPTRARPQEPARVVDSGSSSAYARLATRPKPGSRSRRASATASAPTDSGLRPPVSEAKPDSGPSIKLSPFLRSRPWIAIEGQRFFYSRNCVVQLSSPDLVYFRSQQQARAQGYVRYPLPGCPASGAAAESLLVDAPSVDSHPQRLPRRNGE
jgi:serine/threonine protein kinase